jgi:hypothetical protein
MTGIVLIDQKNDMSAPITACFEVVKVAKTKR